MKTLLVYNEIPETVSFYAIPDSEISPEWEEHLKLAHDKLVNGDEPTDSMNWLASAVQSKPEYCLDVTAADNCCLFKYKIKTVELQQSGPYSKVYYGGFIL